MYTAAENMPTKQEERNRFDEQERQRNHHLLDLYYGNSHLECYYFCQQCEDHFETAGAKGHKRVAFAATFLKDRIP